MASVSRDPPLTAQSTPSLLDPPPSLTAISAAPLLQPVVALQPQGWLSATLPLAFLSSIERIEINETRDRGGVTYYVLDVFLRRFNTRLPAHLTKLREATSTTSSRSSSSLSSSSSPPPAPMPERLLSKPDFQVERRFSEFAQLRAQVYDAACLEPQFRCAYCLAFIEYVRFKLAQPRSLAKISSPLGADTCKRKKMLARFIHDVVSMAQRRETQNRKCESHNQVPHLVEAFVRGQHKSTGGVEIGGGP